MSDDAGKQMDALIRQATGRQTPQELARAAIEHASEMDRLIRRAAGRSEPEQPPGEAAAEQAVAPFSAHNLGGELPEQAIDDDEQRTWAYKAAASAGFPADRLGWASRRLVAKTRAGLDTEARELAEIVRQHGFGQEPEGPPSMDGGARQSPPTEPSFSATIEAERELRRRERDGLAASYDRLVRDPRTL